VQLIERAPRWMLKMNSYGVDISIVRGVVEMVRDPHPSP